MVKESRVLQWYIDSYSSPTDFKNLNEQQRLELMADTLFYMSSFILMLRNKVGYMEDKLNHPSGQCGDCHPITVLSKVNSLQTSGQIG